jgi:hypothetical protein
VSGTGFVGLNESDETLTLTSSGTLAVTGTTVTGENINGSGITVDDYAGVNSPFCTTRTFQSRSSR